MRFFTLIVVAAALAVPNYGWASDPFLSFTPPPKPTLADFDFTCQPKTEVAPVASSSEAEVLTPVEPYRIPYRNLWYVNGSLDPDYQRQHLLTGPEHADLNPIAIRALTDQEVLAVHASDHEGSLDVARFNEYFAARGNPSTVLVTLQDACPNGQCPLPSRTVTRSRTVMQTQACPTGGCPTATPIRSTAQMVARTTVAPVQYFRTRQPVRTFLGRIFRGRCR